MTPSQLDLLKACRRVLLNKDYTDTQKIDTCAGVVAELIQTATKEKETPEMSSLAESVALMAVSGNTLLLPTDTVFDNYADVKKALLAAGGKYKRNTFVFEDDDPQDIKDWIVAGEDPVNLKKQFQAFYTPSHLADQCAELLNTWGEDLVIGDFSAGAGAMLTAAHEIYGSYNPTLIAMDLNPRVEKKLEALGYIDEIIISDFLKEDPTDKKVFNGILLNPPFTKGQDMDHVQHAYKFLAPHGRMVAITSTSWVNGSSKKQQEFRNWLADVGASQSKIPAGEFKESGTTVPTMRLIIDKEP